jgi:hypothetical protein
MAYTDIDKPEDYFNTKLYTGNGTTQSITGVNFQPDWVWIKRRDASSNHILTDAVRGNTKWLESNNPNAEQTGTDRITSFDSDGFGLGSNANVNANTGTFTSWNWLASNTTASNTDGSITSTVSASTVSGFSIVSYTGTGANATVGHGLSSAPKMIILKERNPTTTRSWRVYHEDVGNNKVLYLDTTNAQVSDSTAFNSTTPTSSVFSLGSNVGTNENTKNFIAYCFAEKKGFSKFGSYTGNGSTNGTFVYTGFKPAFVIIKDVSGARSWIMLDNKRNTFNVANNRLFPDSTDAQNTTVDALDFLSNGFKIRSTNTSVNVSGNTYIYMCFAENPFVTSNRAIPATAR